MRALIAATLLILSAFICHAQTNAFTLEDLVDSSGITTGAVFTINHPTTALNPTNKFGGTFEGIVKTDSIIDRIHWVINGKVGTGVDVDGLRYMDRPGVIIRIVIIAGDRGNTGSTIFDINKFTPVASPTTQQNDIGGSTIYTNQANRPSITGDTPNKTDNAIFEAVIPDIISFATGDFFSLDADSVTPAARDFIIVIFLKYND